MRQTKAFLCAALGLTAVSGLAAPQYKVVHLNNSVQRGVVRAGISQANEVVVGAQRANGDAESFSWKNGVKTNLLGLGGTHGFYHNISSAGTYLFYNQFYNGSSAVPFPTVEVGGQFHFGNVVDSMNSSGLAVGYATYTDYDYVGYVYKNGVATLTNAPGSGKTIFFDVNEHGRAMVWGNNSGSFGPDQLYIWENGNYRNVTQYVFQPGPWLRGGSAINDKDEFLLSDSVYKPNQTGGYDRVLLPLASNGIRPGGYRLNNRDEILGSARTTQNDPGPEGYITTGGATYRLLDIIGDQLPSGAFNVGGLDINDNGWIVGSYRLGNPLNADTHTQHAFVMQPVPEPLTLLTLGLGVAAVRRRRKG